MSFCHIGIGNRNQQVNICDNLDSNLSVHLTLQVLLGRICIRFTGTLKNHNSKGSTPSLSFNIAWS
jgi:hypothetical protein